MSPEAQHIAIAKACGWKHICRFDMVSIGGKKSTNGQPPEGGDLIPIPDYLNDLNAMHEAEKGLNREQIHRFLDELEHIVIRDQKFTPTVSWLNWLCIHATSAQRREAFLRAIGKWEGDK